MRPRPRPETKQIGTAESVDRTRMTIPPDAMNSIMDLLIRIYPDPVTAAAREPSTNATDAHAEAGIDDPIEVWLPTEDVPEFVVIDRGPGMSRQVLQDNFGAYGNSTKRGTNKQTGMLGIGAKAPLALTKGAPFTVDTVHEGRRLMAEVGIDEEGYGYVDIKADVATDQPNGTTIRVPMPEHVSISQFRDKAMRLYDFYPPNSVMVDGKVHASYFDGTRADVVLLDPDVAVIADAMDRVLAVQGGDVYEIDSLMFYDVPQFAADGSRKKDRRASTRFTVAVRVPMGTLTPAPSREKAIADDDHAYVLEQTKRYVGREMHRIKDLCVAGAEDVFDAVARMEAFRLRGKFQFRGKTYRRTATLPAHTYKCFRTGDRRRGHKTADAIDLSTRPEVYVITGWETKTATQTMRAKAAKDIRDRGLSASHILFSRSTSVPDWLEPTVVAQRDYEDLKANVDTPSAVRSSGGRRGGVQRDPDGDREIRVYADAYGSTRKVKESEVTGMVRLLDAGERDSYASRRLCERFLPLGVTVAYLPANTHDRFFRDNPQAEPVTEQGVAHLFAEATAVAESPVRCRAWFTDVAEHVTDPRIADLLRSLERAGSESRLVWPFISSEKPEEVRNYEARCETMSENLTMRWEALIASHPLLEALVDSHSSIYRHEQAPAEIARYLSLPAAPAAQEQEQEQEQAD